VWRHIAQSTRGDAHRAEDAPCQDSSRVIVLGGDSEQTLVACVADGAGSAKYSALGSATACEAILRSANAHFDRHQTLAGLEREVVLKWCDEVRAQLNDDAASRGVEVRGLATTLCAAIVSTTYSAFFQIGDGAIILRRHGVCGVVFWPQSGEYVNTTNFLTSNEYRDHLQFCSTTTGFSDVALLTDGIERLALRFDSQTPHPPFFEPLFQALRTNDDPRDLADGLRRFLQSESVRSRSDDDKTLILASCICRENDHAD
jgi:serine/threonine protein phosphatase PrpC